jgi:YVTN family beta-propeller protein
MRRLSFGVALLFLVVALGIAPRHLASRVAVGPDFVHFESGHVHPLAMTPDRSRLLAVNTPDNRLVVFDLSTETPTRIAEIPVGLEPVSVAALSNTEAWVVNQLSDNVSIVDLTTLNVRASIRVGDEPADVVFAAGKAYVSVSQDDAVKAYDPVSRALLATIPINGRMPRALATDAAGTKVYVAVLNAGNRTSVLRDLEVQDSLPPANPPMNPSLPQAPDVGLIVQQQNGNWRDESSKLWNAKIKYSQYDTDIAVISTGTDAVTQTISDLGTVNYGISVSPTTGTVALTATEARNLVRFEPNLRGHMVDTRVAYVTPGGAVTLANLNPHINYSVTPGPASDRDSAIGIPTAVAWSLTGQRAYVSAMGSNRIAVLDGNSPTILARVPTVAGPTGLMADDGRNRLYVLGRNHNELQTLSLANFTSLAITRLGFDPTPDEIVNGRKFFYGGFTSGHGDQACATCHVFGDMDLIAWDLGNPQGTYQAAPPGQLDPVLEGFHPMKGPMVTQSLRSLNGTGLLHWRGDRADLDAFNGAFVDLMGRSTQLPDSEMAAFDAFVLPLRYPPNPRQLLNRAVPNPASGPNASNGQNFFFGNQVDGGLTCNNCHQATNFGPGTNGQIIDDAALLLDQDIKIPQLRNLYKKTGFTDQPGVTNKRGFGFVHDGSFDNLFTFLHFPGFNFGAPGPGADAVRRDLEAFLLAFDTGMAPAVGRQITFFGTNNNNPGLVQSLDTLEAQAGLQHCDLIAKGRVNGVPRGWWYQAGVWKPDRLSDPQLPSDVLRGLAATGSEITITGVPFGSGTRMGIDRDRDGHRDGDELDAHSDPSDPASTPLVVSVPPGASAAFAFRAIGPNPFRDAAELQFSLGTSSPVDATVYDLMGRTVRTIARGQKFDAGVQSLRWDGRNETGRTVGPGVYFVRLSTVGGTWTRMITRLR